MRTALRTIILAIREAWNPRTALFANNEVGVWYDVSDMATLFQDSAGTTPVTAVEQPVGLILDKSKGLVLGAELFSGPYTLASGVTEASNVFTLASVAAAGSAASTSNAVVSGKFYKATFTVSNYTSGGVSFGIYLTASINAVIATANGTYTCIFQASASGNIAINPRSSTTTLTVSNISVRELPGAHAVQATAASRPTLSARKNWLLATTTLSTQNVTVLAGQMVLSFYGTGTVTLSGTSTAGPLVGTGVADRVSLTFTPTAGTLTLTVSGSVTQAQLEYVA